MITRYKNIKTQIIVNAIIINSLTDLHMTLMSFKFKHLILMVIFWGTAKESSSSKYVIGAIIGGVVGGLDLITACIAMYCWGVCVDESHLKGEYSI